MKIKNVSVSQVETARDCLRKWFFQSILKRRSPTTAAQQRGIDLHATIANIITQGLAPPAGHVLYIEGLKKFFPEPGEKALVEYGISLSTHIGVPWKGVIDLVRYQLPSPLLLDWKTTSDTRYAKKPHEVADNLQLGVYAEWAYQENIRGEVRAGLIYQEVGPTPPKRRAKAPLPVIVDMTRQRASEIWEGSKPDLERMAEASLLTDPMDVDCNTTACGKYNFVDEKGVTHKGCPFQQDCGISIFTNVSSSKTKESAMSFLDEMHKKKNGITKQQQSSFLDDDDDDAPPVKTKQKAAPVEDDEPMPVKRKATPAKGDFLDDDDEPAPAPVKRRTVVEDDDDEPAPVKRKVAPVDDDDEPRPTKQKARGIVPDDAPPRDSGGADPLPGGEEAEAQQEKRGRGRPKGSVKKEGFTLYIDCMAVKGMGDVDAVTMEDWWGPVDMRLNEAAMEDKKLPSWWLLDFSTQKAALAIAVRDQIKKGLPPVMLVSSSSSLTREVLPMLLPHATVVVKALRG